MRWVTPALLAGLLITWTSLPRWTEARQENPSPKITGADTSKPDFIQDVRPLLKTYCFECHNSTKRKAGLDLEQIDTASAALDLSELWDHVGERLRAKEMPPAKGKQPTEDERKLLLAWVKHAADSRVNYDKLTKEQLEQVLAPPPMSRRLNRVEYNNTLRDLFGVDLRAGDLLPSEGGGGEGFDNAGATLFTTPVLMEKYLEAAELVLGTLFPSAKDKVKAATPDELARLDTARRALLIAVPGPDTTPRDAARKVLEAFMPRALRRPVTAKEIDRYLGIFDKASRRGDPYDQSVKLALKGVLISPSFLFLVETPAEKKGTYRLDHYEVASHLSYFLWSSMPDEKLFELASQGKLHDEAVLREQVRRMTQDPRARGFADGFASQWLGTRPLGKTVRPDARTFPEFDDELATAMREETVLFFESIVRENRSVLEVIDADYTFVNERLAAHYKIEGVKGPQMRRVKLDDPARGGVLGHAGILTVTSFPHRTSPVLRGRWVLEELLGAEVPPPPPDVPVLNDGRKGMAPTMTIRQQLEKHRTKAECASCHARMDPLGFGLENFDPLGRWRTEQAGQPLDSTGVLPTGEKFSGPVELKKLLLEKRRADFLRNLSRKALGYALGREVKRPDMVVVRDCVRALEQGEFRVSRLLETIVLSYPFSHRNQKQ
jgi:mono/diheme cytochrome c family protein